ncbi:hypothetical protein Taro_034760 [Colocasia esculenta]|uniref:Uncharacterized protein n=1 Tax=Colocasia esculenta TaxID=4460 RepID=A0A843WGG7_COLES|nr:hypothetical protein [Colocasia esculenta]
MFACVLCDAGSCATRSGEEERRRGAAVTRGGGHSDGDGGVVQRRPVEHPWVRLYYHEEEQTPLKSCFSIRESRTYIWVHNLYPRMSDLSIEFCSENWTCALSFMLSVDFDFLGCRCCSEFSIQTSRA